MTTQIDLRGALARSRAQRMARAKPAPEARSDEDKTHHNTADDVVTEGQPNSIPVDAVDALPTVAQPEPVGAHTDAEADAPAVARPGPVPCPSSA
jgi:hypothetical protein